MFYFIYHLDLFCLILGSVITKSLCELTMAKSATVTDNSSNRLDIRLNHYLLEMKTLSIQSCSMVHDFCDRYILIYVTLTRYFVYV